MDKPLIYIASFLIVLLVLPMHEFAHAFAAVKAGDPTPKIEGRYTLNPLKHFDLLGLLMMVLVRFGWAKPVPINPYNFRNLKRDYFFVSVAGITVNLILAFIFALLFTVYCVIAKNNVFGDVVANSAAILYDYPDVFFNLYKAEYISIVSYIGLSLLYYVLYLGIIVNINLFAFNLIPVFPLDGFRILDCLLKRKGRVFYFLRTKGNLVLIALLVWSFICGYIEEYVPVFQYLDVLGVALNFVNQFFFKLFTGFWGLFF